MERFGTTDDGQRMANDGGMETAQFIFSGAIFFTDDGHMETQLSSGYISMRIACF